MIDPKKRIQDLTLRQLNEAADQYFASIDDCSHVFSKPFSQISEAPDLLMNVGYLLRGLRLGVSMTVLEMAAGSCWLSRYLAELRCDVIACDVSPTALMMGRQLFERHPLVKPPLREPRFLLTDGERLDLADESVDRIVVNDGFHHVPNVQQVLCEMYRVLRPGGIAGFSEPGRYHSQSAQSQQEMRQFDVLENDIDLVEIWDCAKQAGFTDLTAPVIARSWVNQSQHESILRDQMNLDLGSRILRDCQQAMTNQTVFFLYKGEFRLDSRSAEGLAARIECLSTLPVEVVDNCIGLRLNVTNSGVSTFLAENFVDLGVVKLGVKILSESGKVANDQYLRVPLDHDLCPGESVAIELRLQRSDLDGFGGIEIDLVSELVCWFSNLGSEPLRLMTSDLVG